MKNIILVSLLFLFFNGFSQFGGSPFSQSALYINQQIPFCPSVDSCLGFHANGDSTLFLNQMGKFVHFSVPDTLWTSDGTTLQPTHAQTLYSGTDENNIQVGPNTNIGFPSGIFMSTQGSYKTIIGTTDDLSALGGASGPGSFLFELDTITGDQALVFTHTNGTGRVAMDLTTSSGGALSTITMDGQDGIVGKYLDASGNPAGGFTSTSLEFSGTYGTEIGGEGIRAINHGIDFKTHGDVWRFPRNLPFAGAVISGISSDSTEWVTLTPSSVGMGGGSYSTTGSLAQTDFVVTHGLGYTPSQVIISPTTLGAGAAYYILSKGSTTFTVRFAASPGVVAVGFDWISKQ